MSLEQFRALGQDRLNAIYGGLDPKYLDLQAGNADGWDPDASMWAERAVQEQKLGDQWRNSLDPATRDQWDKDLAFQTAQHKKHMGLGMKLAMAAITAGAGGMALGAGGGLEGLFGGGAEAASAAPTATGGQGAFLGEGVASGVPAWDAANLSNLYGDMLAGYANPTNSGISPFMPEPSPVYATTASPNSAYMMDAMTGKLGAGIEFTNGLGGTYASGAGVEGGQGGGLEAANVAGPGGNSSNSLFSQLKSMLPSGPTEALKMAGSLGGLYSNYQSNRNFSNLASNLAGLYGPGSAYEEQLRKELQRRDAAAGRRSQYGPRAVELQARLAQLASGQAPTLMGIYGQENASRNNMINSGLKLADQMGIWGKLASLFGN